MNTVQLIEGMRDALSDFPQLFHTQFRGVFPINHVPRRRLKTPFGMIINTDPSEEEGEHWVALFQAHEQQPVEYFDSYGLPPSSHLVQVFHKDKLVYSTRRLQSYCSSLCGEYCILFLLYRFYSISFIEFLKLFLSTPEVNDIYLFHLYHALTFFSLRDKNIVNDNLDCSLF